MKNKEKEPYKNAGNATNGAVKGNRQGRIGDIRHDNSLYEAASGGGTERGRRKASKLVETHLQRELKRLAKTYGRDNLPKPGERIPVSDPELIERLNVAARKREDEIYKVRLDAEKVHGISVIDFDGWNFRWFFGDP